MRTYRTHDHYLIEVLKNPTEAARFLNAVAEDNDPALLLQALAKVAQAHGMSQVSRRVTISRVGLYKMLSKHGNPELKTFLKLLTASGLQIYFKPRSALAA